jgi:hypothetical protein
MEIGTETLGDDTLNMVDQGRRCDLDASHLYEGHFYNKKSVIKENNDFVVQPEEFNTELPENG